MKFWTSEYIFNAPWETVTTAAFRKYPNEYNPNVVGMDVVDRSVDSTGQLHSHRLMSTKWSLAQWVIKILGANPTMYVQEHSIVNPAAKSMVLMSRNLTFSNIVTVNEKLIYSPNPVNTDQTLLKQEAEVTVHINFSSYLEGVFVDNMATNASKGRVAMEHIIGRIQTEVHDLATSARKGLEDMTSSVNLA